MFRKCASLLSGGFLRPTAPSLMLFKPTTPALMLAKPTQPLLAPRPQTEARTVPGRRMAPQSIDHMGRAYKRQKVWQYRFMEVGNTYDRVWIALGGKMKRRRIGRPTNIKDMRYYWRPIEQYAQRTYMRRLRIRSRANTSVRPMHLHASNAEMGKFNSGPLAQFQPLRLRFKGCAPPERNDFEFRVF